MLVVEEKLEYWYLGEDTQVSADALEDGVTSDISDSVWGWLLSMTKIPI
jgi:hypothetical protein